MNAVTESKAALLATATHVRDQPADVSKTPGRSYPAYATISDWCALSGMGRSVTYEAVGRGDLRAIKLGTRTLIDVTHGLAWLGGLPAATIRPHGTGRRKSAT